MIAAIARSIGPPKSISGAQNHFSNFSTVGPPKSQPIRSVSEIYIPGDAKCHHRKIRRDRSTQLGLVRKVTDSRRRSGAQNGLMSIGTFIVYLALLPLVIIRTCRLNFISSVGGQGVL